MSIVLLVIGITLALMTTQAPGAGAAQFQAHTYNMAMGNPTLSTTKPNLHNQTEADAINIPLQQRPWSLSTQEMCFDQYGTVLFALDDYGYAGAFVPTRLNVASWSQCEGGTQADRGNGVYSIGPWAAPMNGYSSGALSPPEGGANPEPRVAVCRRSWNIGFLMDMCSVHLSPAAANGSETIPNQQAESLFTWSQGAAAVWNVTGGDFNQHYTPSSVPFGLAEHWFRGDEMQMVFNSNPTTDGHGKLDYIFAFRNHSAHVGNPTLLDLISDHHYCVATFTYN
jgi:hypothetical protein